VTKVHKVLCCIVLLLFGAGLLTYPAALEAILTAEVCLFSQLLASRTLQATGIVVAIGALTCPLLLDRHLFGWCLVHDYLVVARLSQVTIMKSRVLYVGDMLATRAKGTSGNFGMSQCTIAPYALSNDKR